MQSYSNDPSDYNQRRSNAQRASSSSYMQELNDSHRGRYSRTRAVNLNRDSHAYTKNRAGDDENSSVYSRSSTGVQSKLGKNSSTDPNGHHRLQYVNEQQYETDDENTSSTQTNSFNTLGSSVALTSHDQQEKTVEMNEKYNYNDNKLIPGQHDVYNDFNNNYDNSYRRATNSDVLMDPTNGFEADYTDRDFPGGGRSARQSKIGEDFVLDKERKPRCCCCSRKTCVIVTFIILAIIAVCLYFVWPRIPQVSIDGSKTSQTPGTTPTLSQNPPLVNLSMNVQVLIDNSENWVPYKFNSINVQVYDSSSTSNSPIATGNVTDYTLQPRAISTLQIPILVFYQPAQVNDPTFQDLVSACIKNSVGNGTQNLLNLRIDVTLFIAGIDWIYKPSFSVPVSNFRCPYSINQ